jgi:hypothetical protein
LFNNIYWWCWEIIMWIGLLFCESSSSQPRLTRGASVVPIKVTEQLLDNCYNCFRTHVYTILFIFGWMLASTCLYMTCLFPTFIFRRNLQHHWVYSGWGAICNGFLLFFHTNFKQWAAWLDSSWVTEDNQGNTIV